MRNFALVLSAIALVGCQANDGNQSDPTDTSSVMDYLADGDAKACVDPSVVNTIFDGVLDGTRVLKLLHERNLQLSLENASMTGRNKDIKEVSCTAALPAPSRIVLEYTIRPAASGDGITVNWKFPNTPIGQSNIAILNLADKRLKEAGLSERQIMGLDDADPNVDVEANTTEAAPPPPTSSDEISVDDPRLANYQRLEGDCRGKYFDSEAEQNKVCAQRDAEFDKLEKQGLCWGKKNDPSEADYRWHRCGPDSIQKQ